MSTQEPPPAPDSGDVELPSDKTAAPLDSEATGQAEQAETETAGALPSPTEGGKENGPKSGVVVQSVHVRVGVDIGAVKTTSAISTSNSVTEVKSLRNENLSVVMPSSLSLPGSPGGYRKFGDEAQCDHGNDGNSFSHLLYLAHDPTPAAIAHNRGSVLQTCTLHVVEEQVPAEQRFDDVYFALQGHFAKVDQNPPALQTSAREALSMYLRRIYLRAVEVYGKDAEQNKTQIPASNVSYECTLVAPTCFTAKHKDRLSSAARIAGFTCANVASNIECMASAYLHRHVTRPSSGSLKFPFLVAFVDYGHAQISVGIVLYYQQPMQGDSGAEGSNDEIRVPAFKVLAEQSALGAAGEALDIALASHLASKYAEQNKNESAKLSQRKWKRLVRACHSAKHNLSLNKKTNFMVDALGSDGRDGRFEISREEFVGICKQQFAIFQEALDTTIRTVFPEQNQKATIQVDSAKGDPVEIEIEKSMLMKVELVGGGSRSRIVQDIVQKAFNVDESSLSFMLDIQLSLSHGAVTAMTGGAGDKARPLSEAEVAAVELEKKWLDFDSANRRQRDLCNQLESFISKTRTAISESSSAPDGERLDGSVLEPLLQQAEELTWAEWSPAHGDTCASKQVELDAKIRDLFPGYFAAKEAARVKYEAELESLAAEAKAERDTGDVEENVQRDRRKLRPAKRLKNARAQKAEGNELFSGKNYTPATVRYIKALNELSMDNIAGEMSDEEAAERQALLISCQLNAAQCWLKLGKPIKAEANCAQVLHLNSKNLKALFRRATARYELKEYEKANEDVAAALNIDPNGKAANKLKVKIQKILDKRKAKKKAMASKMFGGGKKR